MCVKIVESWFGNKKMIKQAGGTLGYGVLIDLVDAVVRIVAQLPGAHRFIVKQLKKAELAV